MKYINSYKLFESDSLTYNEPKEKQFVNEIGYKMVKYDMDDYIKITIKKKEKESSQNLVHRFTKVVRQSGIMLNVRANQFRKRPKSTLAKKRSALRRVTLRAEKVIAEKMGKPKVGK